MIRINLLKPGIAIYDDSNPGGIIDMRFETGLLIKPCLYEVFWDKEDFNNKVKIGGNELEREELRLNDNLMDWMVKMAEGNPGALSVLLTAMKEKGAQEMRELILFLDDMNIRGMQIWIGYKNHCDCDLDKFIGCIKEKDQAMIDKINEIGRKGNHSWKAVPHSASVLGRKYLD